MLLVEYHFKYCIFQFNASLHVVSVGGRLPRRPERKEGGGPGTRPHVYSNPTARIIDT